MSGIGLKPLPAHARALSDVDADFGLGDEEDSGIVSTVKSGNGTLHTTTTTTNINGTLSSSSTNVSSGTGSNTNTLNIHTQHRPSGRITSPISPIPMTPPLTLSDALSTVGTTKPVPTSTISSISSPLSSALTTGSNIKSVRGTLLREPTIVTVDDSDFGSSDDEHEKNEERIRTRNSQTNGSNTLSSNGSSYHPYTSDDDEDYFALEFKPVVPAGRLSATIPSRNPTNVVLSSPSATIPYTSGNTFPPTGSSFPIPVYLNTVSSTKTPSSSTFTSNTVPSTVPTLTGSTEPFSPSLSSSSSLQNRKLSTHITLKSTTSFTIPGTHHSSSTADPIHNEPVLSSNDLTTGSTSSSRNYSNAPAPSSPTRSPTVPISSSSSTHNPNPSRINSLLSMGNLINPSSSANTSSHTNAVSNSTSNNSNNNSSNDSPPSLVTAAVPPSTAIAQISELIKGNISPQNTVKGSSNRTAANLLRQPLQILHAFSPISHNHETKTSTSTGNGSSTNVNTTSSVTAPPLSTTTVIPSTDAASVPSSPPLTRKISSSSTVSSVPAPLPPPHSLSTSVSTSGTTSRSVPEDTLLNNDSTASTMSDKYLLTQQPPSSLTSISSPSIETVNALEKRQSSSELVTATSTVVSTTTDSKSIPTNNNTNIPTSSSVLSPRRGVSQSGASFFGAISRAAVEDTVTVGSSSLHTNSSTERSIPYHETHHSHVPSSRSHHSPSASHSHSYATHPHHAPYFEKTKDSLSISMLKDSTTEPDRSFATTVPVSAITTGRVNLLSSSINKGVRTTTLASSSISGRLQPLSATKTRPKGSANAFADNVSVTSSSSSLQIFNEAIPDFSTVKAKISSHWSSDNAVSKLYGFDQPSIDQVGPRVLQFHGKSWNDVSSTLDQIILDVQHAAHQETEPKGALLSPHRALSSSTGRNSIRLSLSSISTNRPSLSCLRVLVLRKCNLSVQNILSLPLMPKLLGCDLSDNVLTGLGTPQSVNDLVPVPSSSSGTLASIQESVTSPRKASIASSKGKSVTDDPSVLENLCWLAFAPHVRTLVLRGCSLLDVPALVAGTSLESLDLSCNRISFAMGFDTVANTLTSIDLSYNDISTTNSLRGLPSLKFLSSLQLHPNPITLTTLPHILRATLIDMLPQLETIDGTATPPSTIKVNLAKERVPNKAKYRRQQVLKERGLIAPRIHPYGAASTLLAEALQVADTGNTTKATSTNKLEFGGTDILPSETILRTRNILNKPNPGTAKKTTVQTESRTPENSMNNRTHSPLPTETIQKKSKKTNGTTAVSARSQRERMSELATPIKRPPPPPRPDDLPPPPVPPSTSKKRTKRASVNKVTWDTIPNLTDISSDTPLNDNRITDSTTERVKEATMDNVNEPSSIVPPSLNETVGNPVTSPIPHTIMSPIPKMNEDWSSSIPNLIEEYTRSTVTFEWIHRNRRRMIVILAAIKQILKEYLPVFDISADRLNDIMDNILQIGGIDDHDYDNIMNIIQEHASGRYGDDANILYQMIPNLATEELAVQANILFDGLDVTVMTNDEQQEIIQLAGKVATALASLKQVCALIANPLTVKDHFVYYCSSVQQSAIGDVCTPFLVALGLVKDNTWVTKDEGNDINNTGNETNDSGTETMDTVTAVVSLLPEVVSTVSSTTMNEETVSLREFGSGKEANESFITAPNHSLNDKDTNMSIHNRPTNDDQSLPIEPRTTTITHVPTSIRDAVLQFDDM